MRRRYFDANSLVSKFGEDILMLSLTSMTSNPKWDEIRGLLENRQKNKDRSDLTAPIFRAKLH